MELSIKGSSKKKYYILAFVLGLTPFLITALPFIMRNGGVFYFYGDFNVQQIPFTIYITKHLSNMDLPQFDFNAGTGLDFFSAYLFYNLFSPFTFIYMLFPDGAIIYAFTFVIALKFGFCALSAYIYASRFCRTPSYAVMSAVLYAYSGYIMANFLYHYLDALAFFPLMPAALEAAVVDKRRGVFGLSVMLCAFTNYYIFGMEAIFIIIYFLIRLTDENFRINIKDFCCLALETVLGLAASGIALIPAAAYIITSPRLGEPFGNIKDMLLYETPWRYARIFQSMFLMPDIQGYTNIFPDFKGFYPAGSRFSSLGMYLPLFGMSGVIAYALANKKSWFTKLTVLCIIIAAVPILNSIFSLGSSTYYARWMFAPTLIMAVMTAVAVENNSKYFSAGIIIQASAIILTIIFCIIFPMEKLTRWQSKVYYNKVQIWTELAGTLAGAAITAIIIYKMKRDDSFSGKALLLTVTAAAAFSEATLLIGMGEEPYPERIKNAYSKEFNTEISGSGRLLTDDYMKNITLLWDIPAVYTFNTTVSPYVNDYLGIVGIMSGDIPDYYPLQCLVSCEERLEYVPASTPVYDEYAEKIIEKMIENDVLNSSDNSNNSDDEYEYELRCSGGNFKYYRNKNFIPMGFCYEYCISEDELMSLEKEERGKFMLKAMAVEDVSAVSDYLDPVPEEELHAIDDEEFAEECSKRAEKTVSGYYTDDDSYNAETDFSEPELVFFSVAYDEGFTAYVDGEEVPLIKANFGFQAIPVPAGKHTIKCVYHSKWRDIGTVSSIIGISGLIVYTVIFMIIKRKNSTAVDIPNINA